MILIAKYPALAKKNIDKINNTVLTISFILVLYRWVCYTLVKRRAFAPLRYFSSLSRISRIIPTIKSLSSSASQAFNLLSDFFFFRLSPLICISPPYIIYYIIRCTVCQYKYAKRWYFYIKRSHAGWLLLTSIIYWILIICITLLLQI